MFRVANKVIYLRDLLPLLRGDASVDVVAKITSFVDDLQSGKLKLDPRATIQKLKELSGRECEIVKKHLRGLVNTPHSNTPAPAPAPAASSATVSRAVIIDLPDTAKAGDRYVCKVSCGDCWSASCRFAVPTSFYPFKTLSINCDVPENVSRNASMKATDIQLVPEASRKLKLLIHANFCGGACIYGCMDHKRELDCLIRHCCGHMPQGECKKCKDLVIIRNSPLPTPDEYASYFQSWSMLKELSYAEGRAACRLCGLPSNCGPRNLQRRVFDNYCNDHTMTIPVVNQMLADNAAFKQRLADEIARNEGEKARREAAKAQRRAAAASQASASAPEASASAPAPAAAAGPSTTSTAASAPPEPAVDDDEVEITTDVVRLIDPISLLRICKPVRSHECKHQACFDFETHMARFRGQPQESWKCPICMSPAGYEKLWKVKWFEDVLAASSEDAHFAEYDMATGSVTRSFTDKASGKRKAKEAPLALDLDDMRDGSSTCPITLDD